MGNCWSNCLRKFKRKNRVGPDPAALRAGAEGKQQKSTDSEAKRHSNYADDMIKDLGIGQNPKIAAGGLTFSVGFDKQVVGSKATSSRSATPAKLRPLVAFNDDEKTLMREISQQADTTKAIESAPKETIKYTREEKEMMAELLHADILRVISETSSPAKKQARAAARRAEMKSRAANNATSATKATLSAQERRDKVKAMATKNRRQAAAAASQMPDVSN